MANDQFGGCNVLAPPAQSHRVIGRGRQGQQHSALLQMVLHHHHAVLRHHQTRSRAAKKAFDILKTTGAGHKHPLPHRELALGAGANHPGHGFVAGHQGVAQAGKGGHAAVPQQALGAGADAAEFDRHLGLAHTGCGQVQTAHRQVLGALEDNGVSLHTL